MSWKNMKVKQKWEWVPEELPESTEELENPARGWLEIYTFQAENGNRYSPSVPEQTLW